MAHCHEDECGLEELSEETSLHARLVADSRRKAADKANLTRKESTASVSDVDPVKEAAEIKIFPDRLLEDVEPEIIVVETPGKEAK